MYHDDHYEITEFPLPELVLKMMDPDMDLPEIPELPSGMSLSTEAPTEPQGVEGAAPAAPSAPVEQVTPMPEAQAAPQPKAPEAPKPTAGAGAPDGLSQITSTQPAQQDSRADSLFEG